MRIQGSILQNIVRGMTLIIRVCLGCVLLWSSLPKLRQPYDFLGSVYEYELVGAKLGMLVAMTLPWLELLLGVCLISGLFVGGALLASTILMGVFVFVQASAISRGLSISCGCFKASGADVISYATLIRTILLLVAAVAGYVFLSRQQIAKPQPGQAD